MPTLRRMICAVTRLTIHPVVTTLAMGAVVAGILLAVGVYIAAVTSLHIWVH